MKNRDVCVCSSMDWDHLMGNRVVLKVMQSVGSFTGKDRLFGCPGAVIGCVVFCI
jgi:hypothetical protein